MVALSYGQTHSSACNGKQFSDVHNDSWRSGMSIWLRSVRSWVRIPYRLYFKIIFLFLITIIRVFFLSYDIRVLFWSCDMWKFICPWHSPRCLRLMSTYMYTRWKSSRSTLSPCRSKFSTGYLVIYISFNSHFRFPVAPIYAVCIFVVF